jgi:hypothetical protein
MGILGGFFGFFGASFLGLAVIIFSFLRKNISKHSKRVKKRKKLEKRKKDFQKKLENLGSNLQKTFKK